MTHFITSILKLYKLRFLLLAFAIALSGCASLRNSDSDSVNDVSTGDSQNSSEDQDEDDEEEFSDRDPLEGFNRAIYSFNNQADRFILKPVATQYAKLPAYLRNRVYSFFSNLNEPTTVANDLLQGKWLQAVEDSTRFVVNSTAGILGLFDVASFVDLPRNDEDFGQTLGRWGVGEGPYLMLPLLGPSTLRDGIGLVPEFVYTDPVSQVDDSATRWVARGVQVTDTRAGLLRTDKLLKMQLDPYIFIRESYRQKREQTVWDGNPPE